jgi:hypothetical protein
MFNIIINSFAIRSVIRILKNISLETELKYKTELIIIEKTSNPIIELVIFLNHKRLLIYLSFSNPNIRILQ